MNPFTITYLSTLKNGLKIGYYIAHLTLGTLITCIYHYYTSIIIVVAVWGVSKLRSCTIPPPNDDIFKNFVGQQSIDNS